MFSIHGKSRKRDGRWKSFTIRCVRQGKDRSDERDGRDILSTQRREGVYISGLFFDVEEIGG